MAGTAGTSSAWGGSVSAASSAADSSPRAEGNPTMFGALPRLPGQEALRQPPGNPARAAVGVRRPLAGSATPAGEHRPRMVDRIAPAKPPGDRPERLEELVERLGGRPCVVTGQIGHRAVESVAA